MTKEKIMTEEDKIEQAKDEQEDYMFEAYKLGELNVN